MPAPQSRCSTRRPPQEWIDEDGVIACRSRADGRLSACARAPQSLLDQEWVDEDRSGTIDLAELKKLFTTIWDMAGEDVCMGLLREIRAARY